MVKTAADTLHVASDEIVWVWFASWSVSSVILSRVSPPGASIRVAATNYPPVTQTCPVSCTLAKVPEVAIACVCDPCASLVKPLIVQLPAFAPPVV